MNNVKQEIQQVLDGLPEDATIEDMMYRLYVRQKIENAREDVHAGRIISQEEVEKRMEKWLAK